MTFHNTPPSKPYRLIPQFGSRSFLLLVLFVFLFLSFVLGALQAYRAYRASIRIFWIVTSKKSEIDNPCYRVAYLFDSFERRPVIIAIEKATYEEARIALPSFCTTNSPIRSEDRVAFQTSVSEIIALESRIEKQLAGHVDADTIEWLWDEYAKACRGGREYQRFRQSLNESLVALKSPVLIPLFPVDQNQSD